MAEQADTICQYCYSSNPAASAFCSHCGKAIDSRSVTSVVKIIPRAKVTLYLLGGVPILFAVIGLIYWIANGGLYKSNIPDSAILRESLDPGTERLLNARELPIVYLGASKEALMDLVTTVRAKDEFGLQQL